MSDFQFVTAKNMKNLEQYGAACIIGMGSIRTFESFHVEAVKQGLLDADEEETAKTILWELQRLIMLYKTQIEHICDRTELNEKKVIQEVHALMKQPLKRKKKNENKTSDAP